jgi:predicted dienelactone hydrolase
MKWVIRLLVAVVIAIGGVILYAMATALGSAHPVGMQVVQWHGARGRPMTLGIWYPTAATPRPTTLVGARLLDVASNAPVSGDQLPAVVVSHGNGGGIASHVDLAMDLASAGYVVIAPMHPGDNFADQSRQSSAALFNDRAQDLRAALDFLTRAWPGHAHVDADRIGAYGFSAGAFTVLTLVGGVPDMAVIPSHCRQTPEFICKALAQVKSPLLDNPAGTKAFEPDGRIKAAVVAAPGLGFTFANGGLSNVHVPVQLWSGTSDTTVPYASNTRVVRSELGDRAQFHPIRGATHFAFLAPCGLLKPPALCSDPAGFDRVSAHAAMNAEVIRFLDATLKPASARRTTAPAQGNAD